MHRWPTTARERALAALRDWVDHLLWLWAAFVRTGKPPARPKRRRTSRPALRAARPRRRPRRTQTAGQHASAEGVFTMVAAEMARAMRAVAGWLSHLMRVRPPEGKDED